MQDMLENIYRRFVVGSSWLMLVAGLILTQHGR